MKRVLITGGSGFIGSHIADYLLVRGYGVAIFDKISPVFPTEAETIVEDVLNFDAISQAIKNVDCVVHAAGVLGTHETVAAPIVSINENVIGTLNVLEAAVRFDVPVICLSKPNVWLNPYSISKDCMEKFCFMYIHEHGLKVSILKLFNVYGPRQKYNHIQKAIPTWIMQMLTDNKVEIFGTGNATMDLVHVRDVSVCIEGVLDNLEACLISTHQPIADDIYTTFSGLNEQILELGSGEEISVLDAVRKLGSLVGKDYSINHLPMRRGEIDGTRLCANLSRLQQLTKYKPSVALAEGFEDTISFYRESLSAILGGKL
ncbi:NAD-dependent epimerase/dehydratase family protein [Methylobacter luteus]|uniref:NAD-dependent epimerase/dehydratase family protein n=1 Tax=Methylobacter luteus TaxID=415 RepID=UPI00041D3C36|nr:NAD-dependent epimerase/dehydratase family protein [Methylobacter luteus]